MTWQSQGKLDPGDLAQDSFFGDSVAVDDAVIVVGASSHFGSGRGAAYAYRRSGSTWSLEQQLQPTAPDDWAYFGTSVAVDGDVVAVGAYWEGSIVNGSGAAYVFRRTGGTWVEQKKLKASDAARDDYFGLRVALSGETLLVAAPQEDAAGLNAGALYFYTAPAL